MEFDLLDSDSTKVASELAAILVTCRFSSDDGMSFTRRYELELAQVFSVAHAVVVSSDSATVTVACGALELRRGASVLLLTDMPVQPWIYGAFHQAGVEIVVQPLGRADAFQGLYQAVFFRASTRTVSNIADDVEDALDISRHIGCPLVADLTNVCDVQSDASVIVQAVDLAFFAADASSRLSTGEGGILLSRDMDMAMRARRFAEFGGLDGVHAGVNHKLSPAQAQLGRARLRNAFPSITLPVLSSSFSGESLVAVEQSAIADRFDASSSDDARELRRALEEEHHDADAAVGRYEVALAKTFDAPNALAVSSGYAAVLVALAALDLRPGDEVLITPTCPLCTVFALTAIGVVPVFCDIRRDCFSIDLQRAKNVIGPRTRAVLDIPMWGYPVPADEVAEFARAHGLAFVLDLALGHGIELHGRHLWHYSDVGTFSTHSSKMLVTGEGGFLLTADGGLAERVRRVRHYDDRPTGVNYRLGFVQAALGNARLPRLAEHVAHRRNLMMEISASLTNSSLEPLPIVTGGQAAGTKLIVRERFGRGDLLNKYLADAGIPSDIKTYNCQPLYRFPVLKERIAECPNAAFMLSSIATIPVHPDINLTARDQIVQVLNAYTPEAM